MDPNKLREAKALETAITAALHNLKRLTTPPHTAGLDLAALLAWFATDFPNVITALAKLIAIIMTFGD